MATSSWNAGIIRPVAVAPTGPFKDGAAPGVWTMDQVAFWQKQGLWPITGNSKYFFAYSTQTGFTIRGTGSDSAGALYPAGLTTSSGSGSSDAYIMRTTAQGASVWQKILGGSSGDSFSTVLVAPSGNIYAVGGTTSQGAGSSDVLITKYDNTGTIVWQRAYGTSTEQTLTSAVLDSSESIYCTISAFNPLYTLKVNSSGVFQWFYTFGNPGSGSSYGFLNSTTVDSSGNFYAAGFWVPPGTGGVGYGVFIKQATGGGVSFAKSISAAYPNSVNCGGIGLDTSGNIFTAGYQSVASGTNNLTIWKFNSSGTNQWNRYVNTTRNLNGGYCAVDSSGNVYAAGYMETSGGSGYYLTYIIKLDTSGNTLWQRSISTGSNKGTELNSMSVSATGELVVTGTSTSNGTWVTKLPLDGSGTGTYGAFTYAVESLSVTTYGSFTYGNSAIPSSTSTPTTTTTTLTPGTVNYTYTVVAV
jgi:hypothetical protein